MKTQRRHELQTNVLADWIGHQVDQTRPYVKSIVAILVACVVVGVVAAYLLNDQSARISSGWSDYYAASFEENPERLRSVAEDHAGTAAAMWALQAEGDLEMARGLRLLYTDRASAKEALDRARDSYTRIVDDPSADPQLQLNAFFGLGKVNESLSELDKARECYEKVIALEPASPQAKEVARRLERLNDQEMVKFYNWFARQQPKPQVPTGSSLNLPADLGALPELPDLPLPGSVQSPVPGAAQPPAEQSDEAAANPAAVPAAAPGEGTPPLDPGSQEPSAAPNPPSNEALPPTSAPPDPAASPAQPASPDGGR